MIVSAITISSNALILLGAEPIASFIDGSTGATIASNLYESSYQSMLTTHRWRFATKKAQLARLSTPPPNGYNYAFQIPSDCLYIITPTTADYEIYGSLIHTNDTSLQLEYIYRVSEDKLPAYYVKMLEFFLAAQFAIPLTGSIEKGTFYSSLFIDQQRKAKFADSTQRPQDSFIDSPYVNIRF